MRRVERYGVERHKTDRLEVSSLPLTRLPSEPKISGGRKSGFRLLVARAHAAVGAKAKWKAAFGTGRSFLAAETVSRAALGAEHSWNRESALDSDRRD